MVPFIGQIIPVGFNFAPVGWFLCQGQLLSIAQFPTLFQLLGTFYGGDGVNTFALPNLCGRVPLNQGQGPGLSNYVLGEVTGAENVTLLEAQVGFHNHLFMASKEAATSTTPTASSSLAAASAGANIFVYGTGTLDTSLAKSINVSGNALPHENRQPYLAVNFIIAFEGIFPSQN